MDRWEEGEQERHLTMRQDPWWVWFKYSNRRLTRCRCVSLGNFISTAEKIRLPDDCTIGYIIEALLEVPLTHTYRFHSHLENLQKLPVHNVLEQVSGTLDWMSVTCVITPG